MTAAGAKRGGDIVERAISELQERIDKLEEENETLRNEVAQAYSKLDNPRGEQKREQEIKEHVIKKILVDSACKTLAQNFRQVQPNQWELLQKACLLTSPIKDYAVNKVKEGYASYCLSKYEEILNWDTVLDVQEILQTRGQEPFKRFWSMYE